MNDDLASILGEAGQRRLSRLSHHVDWERREGVSP
jgi:hypothetical protein